jgi:hypothetical protein
MGAAAAQSGRGQTRARGHEQKPAPPAMTDLERALAYHIRVAGLPEPIWQYTWHPTRRFRADAAYPALRILIEAEGGVTPFRDPRTGKLCTKGGHTSMTGFERDCAKYSEAAILGWCVIRFTRRMLDGGDAIALIQRALAASSPGVDTTRPAPVSKVRARLPVAVAPKKERRCKPVSTIR